MEETNNAYAEQPSNHGTILAKVVSYSTCDPY